MTTRSSEAYDAWHTVFEVDREAHAPWHELVQAHLDLERDVVGKGLLEIGCGRGGFACWLAARLARPARIVAVDISRVAVAKGRAFAARQGLSNIEWEVGDIHELPHSTASFDTVISCETIEQVSAPRRAVAELERVLRPGGRLFLTTPNYLGGMGLYRLYLRLRVRRYTEMDQLINRLTMWPRTIAWIRRTGVQIRRADGVGHYLLFPRRRPFRLGALDGFRLLTRWTALHWLIVAEKR